MEEPAVWPARFLIFQVSLLSFLLFSFRSAYSSLSLSLFFFFFDRLFLSSSSLWSETRCTIISSDEQCSTLRTAVAHTDVRSHQNAHHCKSLGFLKFRPKAFMMSPQLGLSRYCSFCGRNFLQIRW